MDDHRPIPSLDPFTHCPYNFARGTSAAHHFKYRFIDQPGGWLGDKTRPDVPYLTNLRLDPFERTGWPNNGTKEGPRFLP